MDKLNLSLPLDKLADLPKEPEEAPNAMAADSLAMITVVDLNKRELEVKMLQHELVLELREYLNDHVYTCFFTNYKLEHAGRDLNDYTELAELDLTADNKIYMRAQLYDEKSARHHVKRINEIFTKPSVLNTMQPPSPEEDRLQEL